MSLTELGTSPGSVESISQSAEYVRDPLIAFQQLCAQVHVVVVVVGFTVRSEPRLDSFGPVFVTVGRGVFFGPKSFGHCGFVEFVETFVESWVEGFKRGIVNGMGEFVNTD